MANQKARERLRSERLSLQELLGQSTADGLAEQAGTNELGDMSDSAEPLTAEREENAICRTAREIRSN
jgi:hypothetical protein